MEHTIKQTRTSNTIVLLFLVLLERMCYYGIRSILVLYMVSEILQLSDFKAINIYVYLSYFLILTQFIGGIFGDFILNNKKAILIGGLIAVLGCVNAILPHRYMIYLGFVLMILGTGFLRINILAVYGKNYFNHKKYLDSAFNFYYLVLNIGAFVGILVFAIVSSKFGFMVSFGLAAILYVLISLGSLAISEGKEQLVYDTQKVSSNAVLYVIVAILLSALFWGIYELGGTHSTVILSNEDFTGQFEQNISLTLINRLNFYFIVPFLIIGGLVWLKFHRYQFIKIAFGFLFATFALVQITHISLTNMEGNLFYLISAILLFAISEVFFNPIILSIVTRYTNPKYLSTVMAAYAGISLSIVYMLSPAHDYIYNNSELFANVALILASVITTSLFIAIFLGRKYLNNNNKSSTL